MHWLDYIWLIQRACQTVNWSFTCEKEEKKHFTQLMDIWLQSFFFSFQDYRNPNSQWTVWSIAYKQNEIWLNKIPHLIELQSHMTAEVHCTLSSYKFFLFYILMFKFVVQSKTLSTSGNKKINRNVWVWMKLDNNWQSEFKKMLWNDNVTRIVGY